MRNILERYVLDHLSESDALGPDFSNADELRAADAGDEYVPIAHYLFLRQCYDILNRQRAKLPSELAEELRSNTIRMDELVPIRNRVMHGRPLRADDPTNTLSVLRGFTTRHWRLTQRTLQKLDSDSTWEPAFETLPLPAERILHNLPQADYDETGLIGRSKDVAKLKSVLQKRRESIITVTGEGGIGKTALALEVAYAVVDDPDSPFDCVLWASLKSEMLTASGVRSIERAVRDITGVTKEFGKVIDRSFSGTVSDLANALQGVTALVIIDNLESAQGEEIIELYDSLPESVTYFFTSRLGVGQIERRYPLGPLRPQDAELLFRKMAATRGLNSLTRLSDRSLHEILKRLRHSPLAIRWYILSVEAGKEPVSTLRNQIELVNFCVKNVYDSLSEKSKHLLAVLDALDRSVSFDELAVLTDLPIDDLRTAAQELNRGSLVVHEPDPHGGLASRLGLSAAARLFLKSQPHTRVSISEIMHREEQYVRSSERRRAEEALRMLGPNVVRVRGPEDEPTAHLLRLALSLSKRGDIGQGRALIERARALNPDYWEVDRVAAFLASTQRRRDKALALYKSALSKADTDEAYAIVAYFLAGHLARIMHEVQLALPYAIEAHNTINSHETALSLGTFKVWNHEFAEGQTLLEESLEKAEGKTRLIALTSLVDCWRRWGDASLESHLLVEAFDKAYTGFTIGFEAIGAGHLDLKLASSVVEAVQTALRASSQPGFPLDAVTAELVTMLTGLQSNRSLFGGSKPWTHLVRLLPYLSREGTTSSEVIRLTRELLDVNKPTSGDSNSTTCPEVLVGEVISWTGRYGFIKHPDYPNNVFFHRGSLRDFRDDRYLRGAVVNFSVTRNEEDQPQAMNIRIVSNDIT
ncbi:hypothetical protein IMZ11_21505 [Microtetraspora sp. AC03309]|uniref:NB-ARC domain-containing protein n=1 Tax=Microtetraspora sp. AC03309 TaxID=2779376 RepID=UPI001E33ABCC|nr:NB-ARC domain-containing protein [Microtetraspora sp. AC03309]MCC5578206.1 hypothetical protein [Microtetraspora sp. AC03309]